MRGPGREGGGAGRDALALASVLSVAPCAIVPPGPPGPGGMHGVQEPAK